MKVAEKTSIISVVLAICATSNGAFAVCGQGEANLGQADRDLFNVRGCGTVAYADSEDAAYGLRASEWMDRGWGPMCDIHYEYAKRLSSAWVIENGLSDNSQFAFHSGNQDYRPLSIGTDSVFHAAFWQTPGDGTSLLGQYTDVGVFGRWVTLYCGLFDAAASFRGNPASRASDFVHEAWHSWQFKYNWVGHYQGPTGNCTAGGIPSCDYFYSHPIGDYAFGDMWRTTVVNGVGVDFHSANQAQVEFLCDLSEFPTALVPMSVRTVAAVDANDRAVNRFINGPGFRCGDPRPF